MSAAGDRKGKHVSPFDLWNNTLLDHITKQIAARGSAMVEMGGLRTEVRQVGQSWLWTVVPTEGTANDTSLAAGCEAAADEASQLAARAMAQLLAGG